jgi:hypothetical protein
MDDFGKASLKQTYSLKEMDRFLWMGMNKENLSRKLHNSCGSCGKQVFKNPIKTTT